MELMESFDQYKTIVSSFRGRNDVLTNVFFLPSKVKHMIDAKKLSFELGDGYFFMYENETGFARFYFYVESSKFPCCNPNDSIPLVVELPFANEMGSKDKILESVLLEWNFELGRRSARMSACASDLCTALLPNDSILNATLSDADSIMDILYGTFNPLFAYLPSLEELSDSIVAGNVLVLKQNDCVRGVLCADIGKNYASISQFAISSECRGMGLGRLILEEFHRKYNYLPKFWHWVDLDNKPAIFMYLKEGYQFDGRYANEYIKIIKGVM